MDNDRRRQFLSTLRLMAAASIAELITVGSMIPFLALLLAPHRADGMAGTRFLEHWVGQNHLTQAAIGVIIAFGLGCGAIRLALLKATNDLTFGLAHDVGVEIFRRTLRQPYLVHASRNPSEIIAGLDKVNVLAYSALLPMMQGLIAIVLAFSIVLVLTLFAPLPMLLAACFVAMTYWLFSATVGERLRENSAMVAGTATLRMKALREGLGALRDILMIQAQDEFETRFNKLDATLRAAQAHSAFVIALPRVVVESSAVVVLGLAALYFSSGQGRIMDALPTIGALGFGAMRILPLVNNAFVGWSLFTSSKRVFLDVLDLAQMPVASQNSAAGTPLPFDKGLTFKQVSLDYPGRKGVLQDVNFHIPYGRWTAITGPTGSGKSSLLDLIAGLIEPSSGSILIDDRSLDASTRPAWQAMVAHVPQQIFLADGSIGANIAFGVAEESVDVARLRDAADRAQLGEFLASLPDGLDTPVGDAGIRLSGGQRQRIAIARALYRQARLLILDEATGQLDRDTEQAVIETLRAIVGHSATVLVVSHNPHIVAQCDHVIALRPVEAAAGMPQDGLNLSESTAR